MPLVRSCHLSLLAGEKDGVFYGETAAYKMLENIGSLANGQLCLHCAFHVQRELLPQRRAPGSDGSNEDQGGVRCPGLRQESPGWDPGKNGYIFIKTIFKRVLCIMKVLQLRTLCDWCGTKSSVKFSQGVMNSVFAPGIESRGQSPHSEEEGVEMASALDQADLSP